MRTRDFSWSEWTDTRQKCGWHRVYQTSEGDLVLRAYCDDPTYERVAVNASSVAKFRTWERAEYIAVRDSRQQYELLTLDEFDRMTIYQGWDASKNHYRVTISARTTEPQSASPFLHPCSVFAHVGPDVSTNNEVGMARVARHYQKAPCLVELFQGKVRILP